ncbi:methyl-accepting chemotaxis protein [Acetobacter pasteurianus]|uniref:Methyl-accepting chemotaxis protein n=1 Tax=Acetobacter pasteurianus NBRC 3188 TaxID=1226663 RepID=A0A401WY01_ACEPA|nr:methyl-accepting chemotaxis protein [Acetobacter pasteurianus]GCD54173.1 methyl-accepting chemotaxis protein [Acetobacter pasteurianus NBRC 3188]
MHVSAMEKSDQKLTSISGRLSFLGIADDEREILSRLRSELGPILDVALDKFYQRVNLTPELGHFFKNEEMMHSAQLRQKEHWETILSGVFGKKYIDNVIRIGTTHAKIGLDPQWYIAGYAILLDCIIQQLTARAAQKASRRNKSADLERLGKDLGTLIKVALLDMDLSISIYLDKLRDEREKAEKDSNAALEVISQAIEKVAQGDMSVTLDKMVSEKAPRLTKSFNLLKDGIGGIVSEIREASGLVGDSTTSISHDVDSVISQTDLQVELIAKITAATAALEASISSVSKQTLAAEDAVKKCAIATENGNKNINDASEAMRQISAAWKTISDLVNSIDGIATQTNLLALNASVEAARVGEHGRGFSVVAEEIRKLSARTKKAAEDISARARQSEALIKGATASVEKTERLLEGINADVSAVSGAVSLINDEVDKQNKSATSNHHESSELQNVTRETANKTKRMTSTCQALTERSQTMHSLVSDFNV